MELWRKVGFTRFVNSVEEALQKAFTIKDWKRKGNQAQEDAVYLPPHLYGELASTQKGCSILEAAGYVPEFLQMLIDESKPSLDRRGALWVIGTIGKSEIGLEFLLRLNAVAPIVELAHKCPLLSLRGTCFFVIGLISSTPKGKKVLLDLGWECTSTRCVAVPKDIKSTPFLKIPDYVHRGSWAVNAPDFSLISYPKEDPRSEILLYVGNLSNHITTDTASKTLRRLKAKHPELFQSPEIWVQCLKMLEMYKYRLPVRQFIHSLFDGITFKSEDFQALG